MGEETQRSSGSGPCDGHDEASEATISGDAGQSLPNGEAHEESSPTTEGQARKLNPYSSMGKDPEKSPGLMDKVLCLRKAEF